MKKLTVAVLVLAMMCGVALGGVITDGANAEDNPPEVTTEAVGGVDEVAPPEVETVDEVAPPEVDEVNENNDECYKANATPEEIIEADTGLTVDAVKQFDSCGDWSAYEVFADGDIYAVTIKGGSVGACAILN